MQICPFLSTKDKNVECFEECDFYNWNENDGKCPFKCIKEDTVGMHKGIFEKGYYEEDPYNYDISILEEYYEKTLRS